MLSIGSFIVSSFLAPANPITLYGVDKYYEYVRFINNSPYQLSINFGGVVVTLSEFRVKDFSLSSGFQGTIIITPSINITSFGHGQSNLLTLEGYSKGEVLVPEDTSLTQQAVTTTATGKPIFSATWEVRSTANFLQNLAVYNPANSGVIATFHAARCLTNATTTPTVNLITRNFDPNLANAIPAVSHQGGGILPVSVMHCTADDDSANYYIPANTPEVLDMPQNVYQDALVFPDQVTLYPGNAWILELSDSATLHLIRLTLKWTEDTVVPPQIITGGLAVAQSIKNDGNPGGTSIIEVTATGLPQETNYISGGLWALNVIQAGVAHRFLTTSASGNGARLGQVGDILEALGQLQVDQLLTLLAGLKITGSTSPAIDLSAITGAVGILLKHGSLTGNQIQNSVAVAVAGTVITHNLGVIPTMVIGVLDEGAAGSAVFGWNRGGATSTTFTALSSVAASYDIYIFS